LTIPPAVIDRFKALWEWRLSVVREQLAADPSAGGELRGFGTWFSSGRFDEPWAFAQLEAALTLGHGIGQPHLVIRRLAKSVEQYPLESVRALRRLLETDRDGWGLIGYEDEAQIILRTALESGHRDARAEAESTIHWLGERGYFAFRALLSPS
jgi:hypothetical protein